MAETRERNTQESASADRTADDMTGFGAYRALYNNFATHLLNAYNPNLYYPHLPHRWSDADWRAFIDMACAFGFNAFQYWLEPFLFCREGLDSPAGREFARQIHVVIDHARARGMRVNGMICLATVGADWRTLCPSKPADWAELEFLWDAWSKRLEGQHIFGIFPGDPGACSLNGCTSLTFIDRAVRVAEIVLRNCPDAQIELNMWGSPVFGWGVIEGPAGWNGEFVQSFQSSAWKFDQQRADETMSHLLRRLPDFPAGTMVSQNMGFNLDGNPREEQDARVWVREIARTNPVLSWDFSLTEGENAILPHGRFRRLFNRRREEHETGGYGGGICFTMTPRLNQPSLYAAAQSFRRPHADPLEVAADFFERMYGPQGRACAPYLPLFEIVRDWGNYVTVRLARDQYHARMNGFRTLLQDLRPGLRENLTFHPDPVEWHDELVFFATLFADLSTPSPDFAALERRYWNRVYAVYDLLPGHVDPRPHRATQSLLATFHPDRWPERTPDVGDDWTRG